jgi:putative RecB family exonuclease
MSTSFDPNMLSLTPSKLREYQACPKKYELRLTSARIADECSPSLSFGNSMHEALEEIHSQCLPKNLDFDCREILSRHWRPKGFNDPRESTQFFNRGVEALKRYAESAPQTLHQVLGTELYLSRIVRLPSSERVKLGCKVDRLDLRPDGHLEALDYKTNSNGLVPTENHLAEDLGSFLYYVLVRLTYPEIEHVILSQLNVLTLTKVEVEYDRDMVAAHKKALFDIVNRIKAGEFDPRPSSACSWCRVQDSCPVFGPDTDLEHLV